VLDTIETTPQATGWKSYKRPHRARVYLDAVTGDGAREDGTPLRIPPGLSLTQLVDAVSPDSEVVYLCGELPSATKVRAVDSEYYSPFNSWLFADATGREHVRPDSGEEHDATYVRMSRADGSRLDIRTAASWFGTNDLTPAEAARAHMSVTRALRRQAKWESVYLLDTPARTGLDLWRSTIGRHRDGSQVTYPVLPETLRTLIRTHEGQGRFELLSCPDASGMAPALYYLDGRLHYASKALMALGVGPVTHDTLDHYEGYTPARYRIAFQVPGGWAHLGLFMCKDGPQRRGRVSGGWSFPRTPGEMHETWADALEVRNALGPFPHVCETCERCWRVNDGSACPQHGWPFTILERIVYTQTTPLRLYAEKIVAARDACHNVYARAALRNILLHSIGALHGSTRPITRSASVPADVPDRTTFREVLTSEGTAVYLWDEPGQEPASDCNHPELSSQIWDKARASLLLRRDYDTGRYVGALTLPFEALVALRLDAIYTTADPGWPDAGRPGTLRLKGSLAGPLPWPRETADLAIVKEHTERNPA
jgi:hypothetical protein